ncbi:MAG: tRNA 4-thiouridine(8) synthase ThiI, partial [Candidatus Altiarchaeota archaeon]|nr:tRNA 4-thiouridine(8) synthase ThiI [Candidatus Altiarchaeota archaeon]
MYNIVIVRYGEIFLKSEPVRKRFEGRLLDDIRRRLEGTDFKIKRKRHRIYVVTEEPEKAAELLTKVFGIVSVSPAVEAPVDMDEITKKAVALAKDVILPNETFAVRAERTGNHEFSSKDIEEKAGEAILNSLDTTVNLSSPDKTIFVEIRDDAAFLFDQKIRGPGGLPSGTQGKLISLLSGGIDSP